MINIEQFLEKYYKKDDPLILACSAWPDSMYLLYKIFETKYKKNLVVCYFNHKTRPETEDEEQFLENLCKKENIKFETATCDFEKIRKLYPSKSFEELAREKRYQFFDAICNLYKAKKVITAHHLDDKIETFYFNLNRGTKLTGLINMTEFSGWILRPLLNIEKSEILEYLDTNKLSFFIDSSNLESNYTRNYLRNKIIPKFEKVNSNFKKNIAKTMVYFEELKNHIDLEIETFLKEQWILIFNSWKYKINTLEIYWYFYIKDLNKKSDFFKKELIRYIFYTTNNKSTIGLSEGNIAEVIKFINGKNNKTIKDIKNMKLKKENEIIIF
jgi:tRNA(Ile)-lysidine synthase